MDLIILESMNNAASMLLAADEEDDADVIMAFAWLVAHQICTDDGAFTRNPFPCDQMRSICKKLFQDEQQPQLPHHRNSTVSLESFSELLSFMNNDDLDGNEVMAMQQEGPTNLELYPRKNKQQAFNQFLEDFQELIQMKNQEALICAESQKRIADSFEVIKTAYLLEKKIDYFSQQLEKAEQSKDVESIQKYRNLVKELEEQFLGLE